METKITLNVFFTSKEELAIHCDTKEKSDKLLEAFHKYGRTWRSGDSYSAVKWLWRQYEKNTVYYNDGVYASLAFAKENKTKVYEFKDVVFE